MSAAKRKIKDYFTPSVKRRKRNEIHQNSNENFSADCTAVITNANSYEKPSVLEEAATESSGSKKPKTVDMPVLKSGEEDLFPVSLSEFQKYTNVTDLVILDIKKAKPHSFEEYIKNKKYVTDNIHKVYTIFYAKPKYRKSHPIKDITLLNGCPKDVENRIFNIPEAFQKKKHKHKNKKKEDSTKGKITSADSEKNQSNSEDLINPKPGTSKSNMQLSINNSSQDNSVQTVANSYPVSFIDFIKFVNIDEDFDYYLFMLCKGDAKEIEKLRQMRNVRSRFDYTFYEKFYAIPCVRHKLKWKFRPCPRSMKDKILLRAEMTRPSDNSIENVSKNLETYNNFIVAATSVDNNNEESQFAIMVNMAELGENEELFPVSLNEFQKFTNVTDLVNADIKEAKPHSYQQYICNKKYVTGLVHRFYTIFYSKPKYRKAHPLKNLKLVNGCPKDFEKRIYCIPEAFQKMKNDKVKEKDTSNLMTASEASKSATLTQHSLSNDVSQEKSIKSYPVSLKQFKKFVNFDEEYDHYLSNLCREDVKKIEKYRQTSNLRLEFDNQFYEKFYTSVLSERHKLKWKFKPCPQIIKDKILSNVEICGDSNKNASKYFETKNSTQKDNEGNQFANIINLPTLGNEEVQLFPIKFSVFLEKTNVLNIVDEEISVNRQGNMQYIKEIAYKFFIAFYTKPELRSNKPLNAIKCSPNLKNEMFQIPAKYKINNLSEDKNDNQEHIEVEIRNQTSKEIEKSIAVSVNQEDKVHKQADEPCLKTSPVNNSLPTNDSINLMKLFKKYVNCDEIIDEIFKEAAKNNSEIFEKLQKDTDLRSKALHNYYEAFYKIPEIRQRYKFKMKPCPSSISNLILQIPERDCVTVGKREEGNSIQRRKRSTDELDNCPGEMPQLKKQLTLKPEVKFVLFSDFAANLSEYSLKKYFAGKPINCCTEHMQSVLMQRIKERILKDKSIPPKPAPKNKVHIQSIEVIKRPDTNFEISNKHFTLAYVARLSQGLKQRILLAILNMNFDEFKKYTRIRSEAHLNENEETLELYNIAIAVEKLWHPSLYISLLDLREYLSSKGIVISDTDFKHISPIILYCEEIALITNFDEIVRLDYFKETAKKLKDEEGLLAKRRIFFYNKCSSHNQWIWEAPVLVTNWKTILQHNTAEAMPKLIVTPRTSLDADSEESVNEASARETNFTKVHYIQYISENVELFTHSQENPYENDDIETIVYPLHNKSYIVKDLFVSSSEEVQCFRSKVLTLTEKIQASQDVETVIFPIKRKISLKKKITTKPERILDNTDNEDDLDENETNAPNVFRCEATLSMECVQHLDTGMQADGDDEIHSITAEKSLQNIIILSGSDEIQKNLETAVSGQKLFTENEPLEKESQNFFLSRSSESNINTAVRVSQDVLLSSASSAMNSSPSVVDLSYSHLVKTPSKLISIQESKTQNKSKNCSTKKIQFHATNTIRLPLSPNIFVSSSGSTISQLHSENLLQQNTIAGSLIELNANPILEESSSQNKDEFFVNLPNTQTQILSLPSDEHLSLDPLDDEIEKQMNDLFGEDATTSDLNQNILSPEEAQEMLNNLITHVNEGTTSNESNSNLVVEDNEKSTTLQLVIEEISNAELSHDCRKEIIRQALNETEVNQANENLTGAPKQPVQLHTSTELNNENAESKNKKPEEEANIESTINLTSETGSAIVISNERSVQPKEINSSQAAENSLDFSAGDSHITVLESRKPELESILNLSSETASATVMSNVRLEQPLEKSSSPDAKLHVTDDKDIKKETGLPIGLQFSINETVGSKIIQKMQQSLIIISDDDDVDKNDEDSQPKTSNDSIKKEIKFLNNLQFTMDDSNSAPQIWSLQPSPFIVLDDDDDDCNTSLIDQLMNPTEESSARGAGISRTSAVINDDETGIFCEAQKLPSSIEDSDTIQEHQRQQQSNQTLITENNDNSSENNNKVPADSANIGPFNSSLATGDDHVKQQNAEIFVGMSDNSRSEEELILEFNIQTTESGTGDADDIVTVVYIEAPEQEHINLEQQLNIGLNAPVEPQVPEDDTGGAAKINVELQNVNVISNAIKIKKATVTKRKQTKNINNTDVIPQILHTFRPLEVAAVTKTYENKRRSKSPNVNQQENTPTPSQITTTECNNSINSSGATKSFSASQALATDCTLFNNTELLRNLEQIQYKPEEVIAVNVQGTSTCSVASTISPISTASVSEQDESDS